MTVVHDPSGIRTEVVDRLREDLIGPRQDAEALYSRPSDVYLTGILWPIRSSIPGEEDEKVELGSTGKKDESSDGAPEEVPAKSVTPTNRVQSGSNPGLYKCPTLNWAGPYRTVRAKCLIDC